MFYNQKRTILLELVHSYLCGPIETTSVEGSKYFLAFLEFLEPRKICMQGYIWKLERLQLKTKRSRFWNKKFIQILRELLRRLHVNFYFLNIL